MNLISHYFGRDTRIQNHRAMRLSVGTLFAFLMHIKDIIEFCIFVKVDNIKDLIEEMKNFYMDDPVKAVRGQGFIKLLHEFIADELRERLNQRAIREGVQVISKQKFLDQIKLKMLMLHLFTLNQVL